MNPWDKITDNEYPYTIRTQLQGPRPSPLKLHTDSHIIKKPPLAPHVKSLLQPLENRQTVIIYDVSPKVIHTTVDDFMAVVQRLTGSSSASTKSPGSISPATRLASIEKISPPEREICGGGLMGVNEGDSEIGYQSQGILSPAPARLPQIPASMFSPDYDNSLLNDLSPYLNNYMFTPSQSSLLSAPMTSLPSPSSFDILSQYFGL